MNRQSVTETPRESHAVADQLAQRLLLRARRQVEAYWHPAVHVAANCWGQEVAPWSAQHGAIRWLSITGACALVTACDPALMRRLAVHLDTAAMRLGWSNLFDMECSLAASHPMPPFGAAPTPAAEQWREFQMQRIRELFSLAVWNAMGQPRRVFRGRRRPALGAGLPVVAYRGLRQDEVNPFAVEVA